MIPTLPLAYRWWRAHGAWGLTSWHFYSVDGDEDVKTRLRDECRLETGDGSDLVPIAYRRDMDTIAGFVVRDDRMLDEVVTVHLTLARKRERPGWPWRQISTSFLRWVEEVLLPDAADWMTEEDLAEILAAPSASAGGAA